MKKLNQILAVEKGVKNKAHAALTELHKQSKTPALYEGRERTYRPLTEDGEKFPKESQKIALKSTTVVKDVQKILSELLDITFMKDAANCSARADIKIGNKVIVPMVPVTYLLFLEKQLVDLTTFVANIPVTDPSQSWTWDSSTLAYRTDATETAKTKKIMKPVVLYEATDKHPAQVKESSEDVVVGYWSSIQYSGAMSAADKEAYLSRLAELLAAVKMAREDANSISVEETSVSGLLFGYIFG